MELEEGEVFCERCKGTGYEPTKCTYWPEQFCKKCQGTGIVDWITNVTGLQKKR